MLKPQFEKWGQEIEAIRRLSIEAVHARSRERFQALYMIGAGKTNATKWAKVINRTPKTVMNWVHWYNDKGAESLYYKHSGGHPPLFVPKTWQKL